MNAALEVDFERLQTVMEEGESGTNGFMPSEDERAALLSIDDQLAAVRSGRLPVSCSPASSGSFSAVSTRIAAIQ